VLARTEFCAQDESNEEYVNLLRLNHNIAVVCDGDLTSEEGKGSTIKSRVQRIKTEVESIDRAFIWVTEAKEIENYIPGNIWQKVYSYPTIVHDPEKTDKFPTQNIEPDGFVYRNLNQKSFDKCEFASNAVTLLQKAALDPRFDLKAKMEELVSLIREWNA
jgi:putative ATP-dependent endonuclease of the OLD family